MIGSKNGNRVIRIFFFCRQIKENLLQLRQTVKSDFSEIEKLSNRFLCVEIEIIERNHGIYMRIFEITKLVLE